MARGRSIRDLFVRIGFDADDAPLQRIDRGVTRLKGNLRTLRNVLIGTTGVIAGFGLALREAAKFEQTEIAFEVLLRSGEKSKKLLDDLLETARTTPFLIPQILKAGQQLIALGTPMENVVSELRMLGNVAAGTNTELFLIVDAFSKARATGFLMGEVFRQFRRQGVPITEELEKITGKSGVSLRKMGAAGEISFKLLQQAFKNMTGPSGRFFKLMERQSKTTLGLLSNIKDSFIIMAIRIGQALLPQVKKLEKMFFNFLELNKKLIIQRGRKIFTEIGKGLLFAFKVAKDFGSTLLDLTQIFGGLENTIKLATIALFAMFSVSLLTGIGEIVLGIGKIALGITAIGNAAALAQVKAFALPILMGLAVATLIALLDDLATYFTGGTSLTGIILNTFAKKFPTAIKKTNDALRELRSDFIELPKILAKNAIRATKIMEDLKKALTGEGTEKEIEKSKTFMNNILRTIKSLSGRAAGYLSKGATEIIGRRFLQPELFTERQIIPLGREGGALGRFIERPPTVIGQTIHLDLTLHGVDLSESDKIKDVVVDAVKTGMLAPAIPNLQGAVSR